MLPELNNVSAEPLGEGEMTNIIQPQESIKSNNSTKTKPEYDSNSHNEVQSQGQGSSASGSASMETPAQFSTNPRGNLHPTVSAGSNASRDSKIQETHTNDSDTPPMPPRPSTLSPRSATISHLKDIFPNIDLKYIKMALIASEGRLESASNALLFLSDPQSGIEVPITLNSSPQQPPSLQSDEKLARRLARSYQFHKPQTHSNKKLPPIPPAKPKSMREGDRKFLDLGDYSQDDVLDTLERNINDAKQTIGSWFSSVAKKLQNNDDDIDVGGGSGNYGNDGLYSNNHNPNLRRQSSQSPYQQHNPQQRSSTETYPLRNKIKLNSAIESADDNDDATAAAAASAIVDNDDDAPRLPPRLKKNLYSAVRITDSSLEPPDVKAGASVPSSTQSSKPLAAQSSNNNKKWNPAKETVTEPANDAFLVEDSEDDEDDNINSGSTRKE